MADTALLVHSAGLSNRQWRKLAATLDLGETKVLSPDLLGHGSNDVWPEPKAFSYRDDAANLLALMPRGEPVHVVGHSYGAFLALKIARAAPERVRSLTLFDPVAFGVLDAPGDAAHAVEMAEIAKRWAPLTNEQFLESFVTWWQGEGAWAQLREEGRAEFRRVAWVIRQGVLSLLTDKTPSAGYSALAMPTQLITGSLSPKPAQRVGERLAEVMPHARFTVIPGVGHMAPVMQSEAVNKVILEALARQRS